MYTQIFVRLYVCMYLYMCMYVHIYMYTYMYIYMYIYIYTPTQVRMFVGNVQELAVPMALTMLRNWRRQVLRSAIHCSTPQHTTARGNTWQHMHIRSRSCVIGDARFSTLQCTATHCNTLQHTFRDAATHLCAHDVA